MFPKPGKGSLTRERRRKRARIVEAQRAEKEKVRRRDGGICRWPTCRARTWLEVAHLEHAGMGGDPRLRRTRAEKMILLCRGHHQGVESLHSGDLKVKPLTERGTDGPCAFLLRGIEIAREKAVGVLA